MAMLIKLIVQGYRVIASGMVAINEMLELEVIDICVIVIENVMFFLPSFLQQSCTE